MRARRVVGGEVSAQQASEMPFAEDDDVIEAFPSNRPDDSLGEGILPGRSWGDEDLVDPHALHPPREHIAVDGVAITEQVLGRGLFLEGLDKLLGGPSGGRVVGHIDVDEFPASVPKTTNPKSRRNVRVGTTKKSTAAISLQCVATKARHVREGRDDRRRMYLAIVSSATS
jgi:hypothetical protein